MSKPGGIYIHIPFCVRKCMYCAFLSMPQNEEVREKYVNDLVKEIHLRSRSEGNIEYDTVYFGGGTPSVLTPEQIDRILTAVRDCFNVLPGAEITLEANPGTLGDEKAAKAALEEYRRMGINRLSMGVQSMKDDRLKILGRIHDKETVIRDYRLAREAGFHNINLDIIFSIPEMKLTDGRFIERETTEEALEDIREIAGLGPEHISFYSLQLEEGTVFHDMWSKGLLEETSGEEDRNTYHKGTELLRELGYERYEISNFAVSGQRSRHNSKYWEMTDYLGAGLGASGFAGGYRYRNLTDLEAYHEALEKDALPEEERYENSMADNISEAVFTGLRRSCGITYEEAVRFLEGPEWEGLKPEAAFWKYYAEAWEETLEFQRSGCVEISETGIRLTDKGIDISNAVMALFV